MGMGFWMGSRGDGFSNRWAADVPVWKAHAARLDEPWRGAARAMVVVMADGSVVRKALVEAAAVADADGAARALADAVHAVARKVGGYPDRLLVRDWGVATRLAAELAPRGVAVRPGPVRRVESAIHALAALLDEPSVADEMLPVRQWDEHPRRALLRTLVPALVRFQRARPWARAGDEEAFAVRWHGRDGIAVLSHPRGHGHVVTFFTDPRDYQSPGWFVETRPVLGIRFVDGPRAPKPLRRALRALGWRGDGGWPLLYGDGPAFHPGPLRREAEQFARVLEALSAWAEAGAERRAPLPFRDPATGVELFREEELDPVPWPAMRRARPCCAAGPNADPRAALATLPGPAEASRVEAYGAHLRAAGTREAIVRARVSLTREWAAYLDRVARISAPAVTELDLRLFLYDWFPRLGDAGEDEAERLPAALRRYFGWLDAEHGISFPWAGAVLRERAAFVHRLETAPVGADEWERRGEMAEWRAPLLRDLHARVLLPHPFPDDGSGPWSSPADPRVAALVRELRRTWFTWRDEEVAAGVVRPDALRAALVARQRAWERLPHPAYGASPLRIAAEADAA